MEIYFLFDDLIYLFSPYSLNNLFNLIKKKKKILHNHVKNPVTLINMLILGINFRHEIVLFASHLL